uniref:Uncharacterized protein n=1 Tax=Arion vulgaris TaxID=1028688 RepID=A0A0B6YWI1_9EUPU
MYNTETWRITTMILLKKKRKAVRNVCLKRMEGLNKFTDNKLMERTNGKQIPAK